MDLLAGKPVWMWALFLSLIASLLVLDLGLFNRKATEISFKKSLFLSGFYISIAFVFGVFVWIYLSPQSGQDFFTGYLVEKSLSLDNVFVISLIFQYFKIAPHHQHRLLFWGILGALILRALLIGFGAVLVHKFEWIIYVFSLFLIFTGVKMAFMKTQEINLETSKVLSFLKKYARSKLFLALVMIELSDLIFAIDSVPAIFTITQDSFIVYTSNIFAILGLRALYFCLASLIQKFVYLHYSLALVLIYIGLKPLLMFFIDISSTVSLVVTIGLLSGGMFCSRYKIT